MEQIVYGDILFIVNFSMDFLALYISGKILHHDTAFSSLLMASGIGALYAVIILFFQGSAILAHIINVMVALLMCFIVFGYTSMITLIRNCVIFYAISLLMGGCMTAIFNGVNNGLGERSIIVNGDLNTLHSSLSPVLILMVAALSGVLSYLCSALMNRTQRTKRVDVWARWKDREIKFEGICDSGNFLRDPTSHLPVAVCGFDVIKELLPVGIRSMFKEGKIGVLEFVPPETAKSIRIIPATTVNSHGILLGLIPDECRINGEAKRICLACSRENELIGDAVIPAMII